MRSSIDVSRLRRVIRQARDEVKKLEIETDKLAGHSVNYMQNLIPEGQSGKTKKSLSLKTEGSKKKKIYALVSPRSKIIEWLSGGTRKHFVGPSGSFPGSPKTKLSLRKNLLKRAAEVRGEFGTDFSTITKAPAVLHWKDPITGEDRFSRGHMVKGLRPRGIIKATKLYIKTKIAEIAQNTNHKIRVVFKR